MKASDRETSIAADPWKVIPSEEAHAVAAAKKSKKIKGKKHDNQENSTYICSSASTHVDSNERCLSTYPPFHRPRIGPEAATTCPVYAMCTVNRFWGFACASSGSSQPAGSSTTPSAASSLTLFPEYELVVEPEERETEEETQEMVDK